MFETTNQPDVCCKLIPTVAGGFPLTVYPCSGWFNPHGKSLFSHGNMGVFLCDVSEIPCFFSDRKVVRQTLPLLGIKNTINYGSAINPTVNLVNKTNLANENPCKSHEFPTVLGEISIFLWFSYGFPMKISMFAAELVALHLAPSSAPSPRKCHLFWMRLATGWACENDDFDIIIYPLVN